MLLGVACSGLAGLSTIETEPVLYVKRVMCFVNGKPKTKHCRDIRDKDGKRMRVKSFLLEVDDSNLGLVVNDSHKGKLSLEKEEILVHLPSSF